MRDPSLSFAGDGWALEEDVLRGAGRATGALFTTSNGAFGGRGRQREPIGEEDGGVFVAGCYETRPYAHPERSYGFPEHYQTLVAATDPLAVGLTVDGLAVTPGTGTWHEHRRRLDLRTGCVTTTATWDAPSGGRLRIGTRRMASLAEAGLLWWSLEIEALDDPAVVEVTTEVRANRSTQTFDDEPEALSRAWGRIFRPAGRLDRPDLVGLAHATAISGRAIAVAAADAPTPAVTEVDDDRAAMHHRFELTPGAPLVLERRVGIVGGDASTTAPSALLDRAAAVVDAARATTFADAVAGQRALLDRFWEVAAVDIDGDSEVEGAIRFCTFQVQQASAHGHDHAAPAKGLTGNGYEGHQLWDQEVYVGHALTLLVPEAARAALAFRHATLPAARDRARKLSHHGAQFPWRTIDGTEASAFFPAGTAQQHINADIAWAVHHYATCTGDDRFMAEAGVELLVETARAWVAIGHTGRDGRFRIESVTGPDEYTALVDNNLYTNVMAASNLESAAAHLAALERTDPDAHRRLVERLGVTAEEVATWCDAAAAIHLPYDEELGVHGQDDRFLQRRRWDLAATPEDELPLQDHHHLLHLYRHQVLKQADVVLAHFLQADRFERDQRRRDYEYYEPLTTHDSSLSAPIHAVVAADVGLLDDAWRFTRQSALTDFEDRLGTVVDGIHLAAAAGAWIAVTCGLGGFGVSGGRPSFRPQLPEGVRRLRFGLRFRGRSIEVETTPAGSTYRLLGGEPITIVADGEELELR